MLKIDYDSIIVTVVVYQRIDGVVKAWVITGTFML